MSPNTQAARRAAFFSVRDFHEPSGILRQYPSFWYTLASERDFPALRGRPAAEGIHRRSTWYVCLAKEALQTIYLAWRGSSDQLSLIKE